MSDEPRLPAAAGETIMMKITSLGHAFLFLEVGEQRILVDPVLRDVLGHGSLTYHPGRELDFAAVPAPTLIVVSHFHWDHFDLASMDRLPRDVPVVAPDDSNVLRILRDLGFENVVALPIWTSFAHGEVRITATPSGALPEEMGLLFESPGARFWNMVDSEVRPPVAERLLGEHGKADVVAVKYQPQGKLQVRILHGLGSSFDKLDVVDSLESAAIMQPTLAFPFANGLGFIGDHEWLNHTIFPFSEDDVIDLLDMRLGPGRTDKIGPGDVIRIIDGAVTVERQEATFVRERPSEITLRWEPIEGSTLAPCATEEERAELEERLFEFMKGPLARLLARFLNDPAENLFHNYLRWGVAYQLVVHSGPHERLYYAIDFRRPRWPLTRGVLPNANYFAHVSGKGLLRVLRGEAWGGDVFSLLGDMRQYEKIIYLHDGKLRIPPVSGWDLHNVVPEPVAAFFRLTDDPRWTFFGGANTAAYFANRTPTRASA